ncbi:MAG TPA: hypothetical protein VED20_12990, partial [Streptosporangiaceae bacterium]|nr:hypothetical protein [Streptosporangiaceae bacterium]
MSEPEGHGDPRNEDGGTTGEVPPPPAPASQRGAVPPGPGSGSDEGPAPQAARPAAPPQAARP